MSSWRRNIPINFSILEYLLNSCASRQQLAQIHSLMLTSGLFNDIFASSRLLRACFASEFPLDVYYSRKIFDQIENPNVVIWNTMMKIYVSVTHQPGLAISLYQLMLSRGFPPDHFTFPVLIQACTRRVSPQEGGELHNHVVKLGFELDVYVGNTLIHMYSVCGHLEEARQIFDKMSQRDAVSWNAMLAGYAASGSVVEALVLFEMMPWRTIVAWNSMITMMGRQGRVQEAHRLFAEMPMRDVVSWSTIISSYELNGLPGKALKLFTCMNREGIKLDDVTVLTVVSACAQLIALKEGNGIHGWIIMLGFESYTSVLNALIHMYARCGCVEIARRLFDKGAGLDLISWNSLISGYAKAGSLEEAKTLFAEMPVRDVVSWSAMISGYAQHDLFQETLYLFQEMQLQGVKPDDATLVGVLSACAHLCALDQGTRIHAYIQKFNVETDTILGTTLVDMYMKCGCVNSALEVFCEMENRSVSTWNAVILGMAMNGRIEEALRYFSDMLEHHGVSPNEITFIGVLSACRHAGLVSEGRHYFESMTQVHKIVPNVKHYGCMVDLLGRAGYLKEAEDLISSMSVAPDIATWGALLGACRVYRNKEIGERAAKQLLQLQPCHDGGYVLLSNMYALKGQWNDVVQVRGMMKKLGVVKEPGCSFIEAAGIVHEFVAGDRSHPRIKEIDAMLDEMTKGLRAEGYEPDTSQVTFDIEGEEKENSLYTHSEKIAIAFGLISSDHPMPIRIVKNLRICGDCHTVAKLVSRTFERQIVVRDRHRFHHFSKGLCSCYDYW